MKQILILTLAIVCYKFEDKETLISPGPEPIEEDLFELFDLNDEDLGLEIKKVKVDEV